MDLCSLKSHIRSSSFVDAFTLVSDSSGNMVRSKFENYLHEVLALPSAVFEGPSFEYSDNAAKACFDRVRETKCCWCLYLNYVDIVECIFKNYLSIIVSQRPT